MNRPDLAISSNQNSIEKLHIKYWDKDHPHQKFLELSGKFTLHQDKQLDVNAEIYHLMNASAQRVSIKSLDMQRQSI